VIFQTPSLFCQRWINFASPDRLEGIHLGLVETMHTHLDRAVTTHGIHLEGSRNELATYFAADVFLHGFGQVLSAEGHSTLIVVELHIVDEKGGKLLQIALVVGVKEGTVEGFNRASQFLRGRRFTGRLSVYAEDCRRQQKHG